MSMSSHKTPRKIKNILSPVDVNTGPGSRLTLKSLFLQESIYKDIVENLSAKVAEKWVKECCNITPASTGAINKKLIIKETEKALNGEKKLTISLLGRLTQKMNDTAISTELYNFGITAKNNARARKTQLLMHLAINFTNENKTNSFSKAVSRKAKKKSRQSKRMQKIALNESKMNKENTDASKLNETLDNSVTDVKEEAVAISSEPNSASITENVTGANPPTLLAYSQTTLVGDNEQCHSSSIHSKNTPVLNQNSDKNNRQNNAYSDGQDHEMPLKILESSILQLKETTSVHEETLNSISHKLHQNSCGITKIEMSELLDKVNALEKNNTTLLKTVEAQQQYINHLAALESRINSLKEDVGAVRKVNKNLKSKNDKMEKCLTEFENELKEVKRKRSPIVNILEDGTSTTKRSQGTQTSENMCTCMVTGNSVTNHRPGAAPSYKIASENITFSPSTKPQPNEDEPKSTQKYRANYSIPRNTGTLSSGSGNMNPTQAQNATKMTKTHSTVPTLSTDDDLGHKTKSGHAPSHPYA